MVQNVNYMNEEQIKNLSLTLLHSLEKQDRDRKIKTTKEILTIIGTGFLVAGSLVMPGIPRLINLIISNPKDDISWKRLNIPYLKRKLRRLEAQKLIEFSFSGKTQTITITNKGKRKILRYALDEMTVEKPDHWNGKWYLISYDIPLEADTARHVFKDYLKQWNFYPLHESVYLHAYPCFDQVEFLRSYLNIAEYVRIFTVTHIENSQEFKDFFGI